jgi:hypothetical protein
MATYGRGQMLGSGINPESFKQDYSGFARAAETKRREWLTLVLVLVQAKANQRTAGSIYFGGRDIAVTKDGFGNIYDPDTGRGIVDIADFAAGGENFSPPSSQSNQDTGDLLQRSLELNDSTFGSQQASDVLFPDGVAPQGNPMLLGTPTTTGVPKVDGIPTPRGIPRKAEKEPVTITMEQLVDLMALGIRPSGTLNPDNTFSVTDFNTGSLPEGMTIEYGEGGFKMTQGAGVGGKDEKAAAERQKQQSSFVNEFTTTAAEAIELLPNLPDSPIGAKIGAMLGELLPASPEGRVVSRLNTLKANLALDKINQMRAASPTGGAAGNMTEKEWPLFMQEFGALDAAEDKKDLEARLKNASVKLFNRVNGTPEERQSALEKGVITKEQNEVVQKQYEEMLSSLGVPVVKSKPRIGLSPDEMQFLESRPY